MLKPPCETQTAVWPQRAVWSSRKSEDLHKVRTQEFWLLTSHMATCGETPIAQVPHGFVPSHEKTGNPRSVSGLDCLPMSLSPDASGFWAKRYLATDVVRDQGPGVSWNRQEGPPLERCAETGRTLPASVPPFLLLLVLPWCWEQKGKNEGLGPVSLSLSRKLRYPLSRNNVTLLNRLLCSFDQF